MTSASSLAFPGSRTLAAWWRQLGSHEPQTLHVGYIFLHRLDASAAWTQSQPLDPLLLFVLEALHLDDQVGAVAGGLWQQLDRRLHLDLPVLRRLVRTLAEQHLLENNGDADPKAHLTPQGYEALKTRSVLRRSWQRGQFPFVERVDATGRRLAPPHFLKIQEAPSAFWHPTEANAFDVAWLHACPEQTPDWKKTHGFPLEVASFPRGAALLSPQEVIVDRTERLLIVVIQRNKPGEEILGFGVRPEGWVLNAAEPILRLSAAELAAELAAPASADLWQQAWLSWCQLRAVPEMDARISALTLRNECLCVAPPERLLQHWRVANNDVLHGDTWLLAGGGYVRQAARVVVKDNHLKVASNE